MIDKSGGNPQSRIKATIKAVLFLVFILLAIIIVRFTSLKSALTPQALNAALEQAGTWGPIAFLGFYTIGTCILIPGSVLTALGAAIFGPYLGFFYVWIGAMLGSSLAFLIGRTLGRDFATTLIGDRLKTYDEAIEQNGFTTVLYLRLIYFPYTPMNFGMGLTKVRFWDYFAGTALGLSVSSFVLTFSFGTFKEIIVTGDWSRLISLNVGLSVFLFVFSLFIPKIIKRFRRIISPNS